MNKDRLVVNIDAHFDWINPPASKEIESVRATANILAKEAAHKLNQAVQLIILEMLNSHK